jgi:hypothetical protein
MGGSPSRVAAQADALHAVTPDAAPARPSPKPLADESPLSSLSASNQPHPSQRRSLSARKSFTGAKLGQVVKNVMQRRSFVSSAESTTPLLLSQLYSSDKKGRVGRRSRPPPSNTPRIRMRSGVLPSLAGVGKHTAAEAKYPMWLIPVPGKKFSSHVMARPRYPFVSRGRFYSYSSYLCPGPFCVTLKKLSPRRTSSPVSFAHS